MCTNGQPDNTDGVLDGMDPPLFISPAASCVSMGGLAIPIEFFRPTGKH